MDFEPFLTGGGCSSCIIYLCPIFTSHQHHHSIEIDGIGKDGGRVELHMNHHRPLMTLRNRIIRIIRFLRTTYNVTPIHAYFVAGGDVDDLAGDGGFETGVAGDVCVVDVGDGVVGLGGADAVG